MPDFSVSHGLSQETLDQLRFTQERLEKAAGFTSPAVGTAGLQYYNLDPVVKHFYPVETPFRNMVARNSEGKGTASRWKAITGINTTHEMPGVSEGNRGAVITHTTEDYLQPYAGLGLEDFVTFEAEYAADGLININAEARVGLLAALMMAEEEVLIGGNYTALGVVSAPVGVLAAGGAATAGAYFCRVVAYTADGMARATLALGSPGQLTKTNMDGSSDVFGGGNTAASAEGTQTTSAGNLTIVWTVPSVPGAFGYGWYIGATTGAANTKLVAITSGNVYVQTTVPVTTGQAANHANVLTDFTSNSLLFDGYITQIAKASAGAITKNWDGAGFGVDSSGSVDVLDDLFQRLWNTEKRRISGDEILLNGNTFVQLSKLVLGTANNHPNISINVNPGTSSVTVGMLIGGYRNKWAGGKEIPFRIVSSYPDGVMTVTTRRLPMPRNGVSNTMIVEQRQPYYSITWPLVKRRREYGVYVDECLKVVAPFAHGLATGVGII